MLDLFRSRGLSSIVYGVVIVATILVFVIQFNPSAGKKTASLGEQCAATVNGWCVTPKDHLAAYRIMIPRGPEGELQTARAKQMGLMKISLDGLIERELLIREADRLGLTVTEDEITDSIFNGYIQVSVPSDNPALANSLRVQDGRIWAGFRDQKTHHFDLKVYQRSIKMLMGRSEAEFRDEQGRELIAAKLRDLVRSPIRVSESDALESYIGEKSTATVQYIPVKQSYVSRYALNVSQADVDAWAKEKTGEAFVDNTLSIRKKDLLPKEGHYRHILVKVAPSAAPAEKAIALGKLARAYQRIKAGSAFSEIAREVSDDTGSAAHGGDVGDKTDGFVGPFKKAADVLKPGEMTNAAIETQFGYHLIEKDDPAKSADVEAALTRDTARDLYTKTKSLDITKDLGAKILAGLKAGKKAEDAIHDTLAPFEKAAAPIAPLAIVAETPDKSVADAGASPEAGAASTDKKSAASPAIVPKAATALTDPDRPELVTSSSFNKGGEPIPDVGGEVAAQVLKFAFSAKEGDAMPDLVRSEDGFVVVELKEHKLATHDDFTKERDTYMQTLLAAKEAEALALYVRRLHDKYKSGIKVDEKYMAEKMPAADGGLPADLEDEEGP